MTTITTASRAEWLAERRNGLGASDIPAILGISPYKSAYALWVEKCGLLPADDDIAIGEALEWGLRLEPVITAAYAERTGRMVDHNSQSKMYAHPELPYLRFTPDAFQLDDSREGLGDLQIKTTSAWRADDWKAGAVPLAYQAQVQAELFVGDLAWGSIVCLIGGQRMIYGDVERNDRFIESALPHIERFWRCVETRTPPPIDGSDCTRDLLARLYPDDSGESIELPAEAGDWLGALAEAKDYLKKFGEWKALAENNLKAALGEASIGILADGRRISYKVQERAGYEVKPAKFRVLRELTPKKG